MSKELRINTKWCKGCRVCVEFCPKKVLSIKNGKVFIENADACIACGQCELRCPDYAIFLKECEGE